jgi:hypothetical protein
VRILLRRRQGDGYRFASGVAAATDWAAKVPEAVREKAELVQVVTDSQTFGAPLENRNYWNGLP